MPAGRGQKPVSAGLASGRAANPGEANRNSSAQFHFPVAQGQAAPSAAARGSLSFAQQSERARTGEAVAVLHSAHASGGGLHPRRLEPAPNFPIWNGGGVHLFVSFLAYCLHALAACLHPLAPGLTPRSLLKKFAAIQMLDVFRPPTDGNFPSLHPERSQNTIRYRLGTAAAITPAHHAEKGQRLPEVWCTFWIVPLICNELRVKSPSSCESRVKLAHRCEPTCH